MAQILVADDDEGVRTFLAETLERQGHEVQQAADGSEASDLLDQRAFDLVVTDLRMPGLDGVELLRKVRTEQPDVEVIMLTAHGTVDTAVEAMRLGAFDYIQKPVHSPTELRLLASRALERRTLRADRTRAELDKVTQHQLTWGDPAMVPVVEALHKVAPTNSTVLLLGESGTGKEVAANALHQWSDRADAPFVAINCATLPDNLLESELFGHEKGAFTGAHAQRRGRIELAHSGTFFLDEIADLKPELQARLLRVLQERRFHRVGGNRVISVDVRWIAATNRDLGPMLADGRFRDDLYHRLAVFPIRIPPLRERPQDIAPLAAQLLQEIAGELGQRRMSLSDAVVEGLVAGSWTGNVRELRNTLERACILADGEVIQPDHIWLDPVVRNAPEAQLPRTLAAAEQILVEQALEACGGNRKQAAKRLGIGVRTLYDKIKKGRAK